jgi:hypothetical protein
MIKQTEEDIKDSEIKQAFELLEKKRLKKLFNDIEKDKLNNENPKITPIFTWMKFAVAASVFGLVLTTGILYLKNGKETQLANIVKKENPQLTNEIALLNERKLKSSSKSTIVLTDNSFGFAKQQQNIIIKTHELGERIDTLISVAKKINDTILRKRFNIQIDSLENQINTYYFSNNELSIYLRKKSNVKVVFIQEQYYLILDNNSYYTLSKKYFDKLKKVTDSVIINEIERTF